MNIILSIKPKYAERSPVYGWLIVKAERYICSVHPNWFNLKRPPQSWQYTKK